MPKVTTNGKVKHFPYTKGGIEAAKKAKGEMPHKKEMRKKRKMMTDTGHMMV